VRPVRAGLAHQPRSTVSRVYFPQNKKAPTFPRVWRAGTGLWSATSGSSALWTRVSGAGLCLLFSNFRFRGRQTGSTVGRDRFEARSREAIAPSESKAQELTAATAATKEPEPPLLLGPGIGQGFGEAGDRQIRRRGAIDDGGNDAGR
jgi:hypothetical protein